MNSIEPQIWLVDDTHASVDHNQLQSVIETDDPIDESGYECEDETGYDGHEIENEDVDGIEDFKEVYETKNDKSSTIVINLRETYEGSNIINVDFKSQDGNDTNDEIVNDGNVKIVNDENFVIFSDENVDENVEIVNDGNVEINKTSIA